MADVGQLTYRLEIDDNGFDDQLDKSREKVKDLGKEAKKTERETNRSLKRIVTGPLRDLRQEIGQAASATRSLQTAFSGFRGAALVGTITVGAGVLTELAGAAAAASGALLTLPAAGAVVVGAFGVAKIATLGLGDALSAVADGDAEEFSAALKNLSPPAQEFALALRDLRAELTPFQRQIQGRVFEGFGERLRELSKGVLPGVRRNFLNLADALNELVLKAADASETPFFKSLLQRSLDGSARAVRTLSGAVSPLIGILDRVVAAGMPFIQQLAVMITDSLIAGEAFLRTETGFAALQRRISTGASALGQILDLAGALGSALVNLFNASASGGQTLIQTLTEAVNQFNTFATSADGKESLQNFFRFANQVLSETLKIVGSIAGIVLAAINALSGLPQPVRDFVAQAVALGIVLTPVILGLATFINSIIALKPLLGFAAGLIRTIGVIPTVIGVVVAALIFLQEKFDILGKAMEFLSIAVDVSWKFIVGVFEDSKRAIGDAINATARFFQPYIDNLVRFKDDVKHGIDETVKVFDDLKSGVVKKFSEAKTAVTDAFNGIVKALEPWRKDFLGTLGKTLEAGAKLLIDYDIKTLKKWGDGLNTVITTVAKWGENLLTGFAKAYDDAIRDTQRFFEKFPTQFSNGLKAAVDAVVAWGAGVVSAVQRFFSDVGTNTDTFFRELPGKFTTGFNSTMNTLATWGSDLLTNAGRALNNIGIAITNFFAQVPEAKKEQAKDSGIRISDNVVEGIKAFFTNPNSYKTIGAVILGALLLVPASIAIFLVDIGLQLAGIILKAIGQLGIWLFKEGVKAIKSLIAGAASAFGAAGKFFGELPGKVDRFLGDVANTLVQAGKDMIDGLVRGITDGTSAVVNTIRDICADSLNAVKKFFGIHSPSRVMRRVGEFITQGMIDGIKGNKAEVKRQAADLANTAIKAARDKLREVQRIKSDFEQGVSRGIITNITGATTADDSITLDSIRSRLIADLGAAKKFNTDLAKVIKLGLSDSLVRQISEAGLESGGATAAALATASKAQIAEINRLRSNIGTTANSIARRAGNELFGAGVQTAAGLVRGLISQKARITSAIISLAHSMKGSLKKALGIKSPSRVMAEIGEYMMLGLAQGISKSARLAVNAATNASGAAVSAFSSQSASNSSLSASPATALRAPSSAVASSDGTSRAGAGVTVNQTNNINTEVDMKVVNRGLAFDLGRLL